MINNKNNRNRTKYLLYFVIGAILMVVVLNVSAQYLGRFVPTHKIQKDVQCFNCHAAEVRDLSNDTHIKKMPRENKIVQDYYELYGNSYRSRNKSNSTIMKDVCYSCHLSSIRYKKFALSDPYIFYNRQRNGSAGIYNNTQLWIHNNGSEGADTEQIIGTDNNTPNIVVSVEDIFPENETVDITIKFILANFSGQQANTTFEKTKSPGKGKTVGFGTPPIYGDYFNIILILDGLWDNLTITAKVTGTNVPIAPYTVRAYVHGIFTLPNDFPENYNAPYFHTENVYLYRRLDRVWNEFNNAAVGNISALEGMNRSVKRWMGGYTTWENSYTCSSPGAMCHIDQKITYIGSVAGLPNGEAYYKHNMEYSTPVLCKRCHL